METWWHDFRHGLRVLASQPAFATVAVVSLSLGIGANTAIFSVTDALLLRPLPYDDADRIAILWQRSPGLGVQQDWFSLGQFVDIRTDNQVFTDVAATIGASFNLTGRGVPERIDGARVSSSLFTIFGAKAAAGRVFTADEDRPGKPPVVNADKVDGLHAGDLSYLIDNEQPSVVQLAKTWGAFEQVTIDAPKQ